MTPIAHPHRRLFLFAVMCLAIAIGWGTLACQEEPFDRKAMLLAMAQEVVIPSYTGLVKQSKELHQTATALCKETTLPQLTKTRDAWIQTKLAWKRSQIFRFGPAETLEAQAHIDYWPTKPSLIEQELTASTPIDAAYVEQLGASRRGLPAIEYLLFDPKKPDSDFITALAAPAQGTNRRCDLMVALADGVARRSQMLLDAWQAAKGDAQLALFLSDINKDKSSLTWQPAIDEIINELSFTLQVIVDRQLGEPLGHKNGGTSQPETAEAFRSQQSLACIRASLEGAQQLYTGTPDGQGAEGKGISALLTHRSKLVDGHMKRDLNSTFVALTNIKQPDITQALEKDKPQLENAWEVAKALLTTLRVEVVGDLGVVLTFSDLDGD